MKIYALAVMVIFFVIQNITAVTPDWQYRTKLNHWTFISRISDRTFGTIRKSGNTSCASEANKALRSMTESAKFGIWSCVDASTSEARGIACAKDEVGKASAKAAIIANQAKACRAQRGR